VANNADSVGLFVVGAQRARCDFGSPGCVDCSVLTVGRNHL
jgi:hypothetical protein